MTMTRQDLRQQLEDVIDRQLVAHHGVTWSEMERNGNQAIDASRRAILAAVDEWAASQADATPPAGDHDHIGRRGRERFRARLARALDTTTGGTR